MGILHLSDKVGSLMDDRRVDVRVEGKPLVLDAVTLGIVRWALEHRALFQLPRFRGCVAVEFHVDTEKGSLTVHPRITPDT